MESKAKWSTFFTVLLLTLTLVSGVMLLTIDIGLKNWVKICCGILFFVLATANIIFKMLDLKFWSKICILCEIAGIIVLVAYIILWSNNWLVYFSSMESIKNLILSTGVWGVLVFILIQFLQVVVIPIPAMITTLAGVAIYGPFQAMIYSLIGIISGSVVAFLVGRWLGRPLVVWVAGEEQTNKYAKLLGERGKFFLPIIFLLPVFPDDIICMIAGITSMTLRFFFVCTILFRPVAVVVTCYLGSGQLIPFSGWGLIVWPILIALLIVFCILVFKYQTQIEEYFMKKFKGKHTQENKVSTETNTDSSIATNQDKSVDTKTN